MIPSPYKHFKAIFLILGAAVLSGTAFIPSRTNEKQRKLTSLSTPQLPPQLSSTHNSQQHFPATVLRVVADPPMKEDEKKKEEDEGSFRDWIKSNNGGFIPIIRARLRRPLARGNRNSADKTQLSGEEKTSKPKPHQAPMVLEVNNIQDYKTQVVDVPDKIVCVRFYAPWCKACKAVEASFHRLSRKYLEVQFVEVPVTKENVYLHKGLGVHSLPFGHIYDPIVGLVEERKINKNMFNEFQQVLQTYVDGQCRVSYSEDGKPNSLQ